MVGLLTVCILARGHTHRAAPGYATQPAAGHDMNAHTGLKKLATGTALALGFATGASAATIAFTGAEFAAPGQLPARFVAAGGDADTPPFHLLTAGYGVLAPQPAPFIPEPHPSAGVTGAGSLATRAAAIDGVFAFPLRSDHTGVISATGDDTRSGATAAEVMAAIPIPATFGLLGLGIAGLGLLRRRTA